MCYTKITEWIHLFAKHAFIHALNKILLSNYYVPDIELTPSQWITQMNCGLYNCDRRERKIKKYYIDIFLAS